MTATVPLAFIASWALVALYLPLGRRLRQLDLPNARSAHARPVPSSGGIAVILALLLALGSGAWRGEFVFTVREGGSLCILVAFCVIGLADDRRPLPVAVRLPLFLLLSLGGGLLYLPAGSGWLPLLAVSLALAWLVNLFNFMDGIDGIAALQCTAVAAALGLLGWLGDAPVAFVVTALALAAAYAAFLVFNWPPARLFMGDAGSLSAGYALGWLGLWGAVDGFLSLLPWLLLMSPFLLDTGLTLAARVVRGERITQAHNQHVYQHLARQWGSHRRVDAGLLALLLLWLIPLAVCQQAGLLPALPAIAIALVPQLLPMILLMTKTARLQ